MDIQKFIDCAPNINLKDEMGRTALHLIAGKDVNFYGKKIIDRFEMITKVLLQKGAHVNERDNNGQTALFLAVKNRKKRTIEILLENGAEINCCDSNQISPLLLASVSGDMHIVKLLLDSKSDIFVKDKSGNNCLHLAAKGYDLDIVQLLLDYNVPVDSQRDDGFTSLHIAVEAGNENVVDILLKNNANVNIKDIKGRIPFHILAEKCLHGCTKEDIQKFKRIAKSLLLAKSDLNSLNNNEETALHCAVSAKNLAMVKLLIKGGVNISKKDKFGNSIFHHAIKTKNIRIIEVLLQYGSDINDTTFYGKTPLHIAIESEDAKIIQYLLDNGADYNALDNENRSALFLASKIMFINTLTPIIIVRYLAKLDQSKLCSENISLLMNNVKLNELYFECLKEIKKLKCQKLSNNISFYSILSQSDQCILGQYARNANVVKAFKSKQYTVNFPFYCDILREKFYQGLQRKHLSERVEKHLEFLWVYLKIPKLIIQNIMDNISDNDLQFLLSHFEDSR